MCIFFHLHHRHFHVVRYPPLPYSIFHFGNAQTIGAACKPLAIQIVSYKRNRKIAAAVVVVVEQVVAQLAGVAVAVEVDADD
jgi:hypothetical protein